MCYFVVEKKFAATVGEFEETIIKKCKTLAEANKSARDLWYEIDISSREREEVFVTNEKSGRSPTYFSAPQFIFEELPNNRKDAVLRLAKHNNLKEDSKTLGRLLQRKLLCFEDDEDGKDTCFFFDGSMGSKTACECGAKIITEEEIEAEILRDPSKVVREYIQSFSELKKSESYRKS